MPVDPYVRVYYRIIDDPKFVGIYGDDRHLSTWLRLLLMADAVWPASVPIPRSVKRVSLSALVRAGLVEYAGNDHYRIHGLDAERNMRSHSGRNAAAVRWQSERTADPMLARAPSPSPSPSPRQARARTREDLPVEDGDGYDRVVQWMAGHGAWADSPKLQTDLARLVDRHGADRVLRTMGTLWEEGNTEAAQLIYGARNTIHPLPRVDARAAEREERADEERKHHEAELARTRRMIEEEEAKRRRIEEQERKH